MAYCLTTFFAVLLDFRVSEKKHGDKLKQSLCIARKIAKSSFEIVQHYGSDYTTTSLKSAMSAAEKDAKKYEYPASLAIKLRIRTERCHKKQG